MQRHYLYRTILRALGSVEREIDAMQVEQAARAMWEEDIFFCGDSDFAAVQF